MTKAGNISSEAVFETLRVLCATDRPLGVAEFHRVTNEPTSSVHRAIATLEEAQFAERYQGSARFAPGRMCSHLVRALVNRYALRRAARPFLMRLVDLVDGPATLNARLGWYAIRIASLEGRAEYHDGRRLGETRLLHLDVSPPTLLCYLRPREREEYNSFVEKRLQRPIASFNFGALLRRTVRDGYAVAPDPSREGFVRLSYPLMGQDGRAIASVTVAIPDPSSGSARDEELMREIATTVKSLQAEIAADPSKCAAPFGTIPLHEIVIPQAEVASEG